MPFIVVPRLSSRKLYLFSFLPLLFCLFLTIIELFKVSSTSIVVSFTQARSFVYLIFGFEQYSFVLSPTTLAIIDDAAAIGFPTLELRLALEKTVPIVKPLQVLKFVNQSGSFAFCFGYFVFFVKVIISFKLIRNVFKFLFLRLVF